MTPRYKERLSMRCPVVFAGNGYLSEGYVLNLTAPGCLIASVCPAHPGDYVQLKMVLPGLKVPFYVEVAAVRWTDGRHLGVEFIQMSEADQASLNLFLGLHLSSMRARTQRGRMSERREFRRQIEQWRMDQ